MNLEEITGYALRFWHQYQGYIFALLKGISLLIGGIYLAFLSRAKLKKMITKKDEIVGNFISQVFFVCIIILSAITALGTMGVQTTSIIAVLGTATLAIALALKDSLSSLASGIVLIILRPFKKGDLLEIGSIAGKVEAINLFHTTLRLPDNKLAIFPNENVTKGVITNCTDAEQRRIEWVVGVAYTSNIEEVKATLIKVILQIEEISKDPFPFVGVTELSSSSIDFSIRVWIENHINIFAVRSKLIEECKKALDDAGIEIPYNQLDVRVSNK
ncbi:mechanosensitive ion channel protein [Helicobacter cholecystus]|uniref:Mechanosensitive ion channel protein n=1 Tax=Helicobacter cholecystus TaxID=45498 RepID=A0A3D8IWS3_9HELI|nr:mechanosensitive ion channel domain-containing protein [Helicobacter cholecystus]RDU69493.1 mechanosensitive ion channel protein [Helicobacter cholecystus]VEJ24045.1 putative mechanosensitive ion channel [Helicobacter cholecystus]